MAVIAAMVVMAASACAARPCDEFHARLPKVRWALCDAARLEPSPAKSVKGRSIFTRDIEPDQSRLRVLVVGGIHGDKLPSTSVALHWIRLAQAARRQSTGASFPRSTRTACVWPARPSSERQWGGPEPQLPHTQPGA